jgi:hypothetical protein
LPEASLVSLRIFDVVGREVVTLVNASYDAGYYSTVWDASNQASGVYFARIQVNDEGGKSRYTKVKKLVLLR